MERLSRYTAQIENARRGRPLIRSAVVALLAHAGKIPRHDVLERIYPKDNDTALLTKAAVTPTGTAATALLQTTVSGFYEHIGQQRH